MPTISQGMIDFALSPPIGVMNVHLDIAGPYGAGSHTLPTWTSAGGIVSPVGTTYGVVVQLNGAIPPKLGLTPGYTDGASIVADVFENRVAQLVVMHQLLAGTWVITQIQDLFVVPLTVRWTEAIPGRIGLFVSPFLAIDLFYLQVA